MKFELGPGLRCDLQTLIDTRALIQANSGGGKSWMLRRLLEQTAGHVQQIVIDPEGEFGTLRERFDYVLAAKHAGDTAADPRSAKLLAERLLDLKVSAICDIYELKAHDRIKFVRHFFEAMTDSPKALWHPVLVVQDEIHVMCPQQGEAESASAVIDAATRWRKRGFCLVGATQRLSKLHKDCAAELNNKLIGRTGLDVDMKRAGEELGFTSKEQLRELRELTPGEFFAFGPALAIGVTRVKVGDVQTSHPKAGSRIAFTAPPATDKIKALLPKLADLPAEAEQKQKSLDDLKRDNADLRRQLTIAQRQVPAPPAPAKPERVEVPILTKEHLQELQRTVTMIRNVLEHTTTLAGSLTDARGELGKAIDEIQRAIAQATRPALAPIARPALENKSLVSLPPRRIPTAREVSSNLSTEAISNVEQRILDALAELEALGFTPTDKRQLAFFAGYTNIRSGGFSEPLGRLVTRGLIHSPAPGIVTSTEAGRAIARPSDMPATTEALQERILEKLDGPRKKLLRVLIEAYPDDMSKVEHAERCGYANIRSGGYSEPLGSMVTVGLVESPEPGRVRAADALFLETTGARR